KTWLLLPITALLLIPGSDIWAQGIDKSPSSLLSETGIIITIILLSIPILFAILFLIIKVSNALSQARNQQNLVEADLLAAHLRTIPDEELIKRQTALN